MSELHQNCVRANIAGRMTGPQQVRKLFILGSCLQRYVHPANSRASLAPRPSLSGICLQPCGQNTGHRACFIIVRGVAGDADGAEQRRAIHN